VFNLREAGAKEVHMRILVPAAQHACHYGIDFPDPEKLIANQHSMDQIRDYLGADSIGYLDVPGMVRATGQKEENSAWRASMAATRCRGSEARQIHHGAPRESH